jgi:hypothetical protein
MIDTASESSIRAVHHNASSGECPEAAALLILKQMECFECLVVLEQFLNDLTRDHASGQMQ